MLPVRSERFPAIAAVAAPPLRVSFSWTLAGNVVYAACQFGMLSVLAKLGSAIHCGPVRAGAGHRCAGLHADQSSTSRECKPPTHAMSTASPTISRFELLFTLLGLLVIVGIAAVVRYDVATKIVILLVGGR